MLTVPLYQSVNYTKLHTGSWPLLLMEKYGLCWASFTKRKHMHFYFFLHFPKHPNYDFPCNAMAVFFYLFWQLCNSFPVGFPLHARSLCLLCVCTLNLIKTTIKQRRLLLFWYMYVYEYFYVYVYTCKCIYLYVCVYTYFIFIYTYTYMYVNILAMFS